jgi:hypothetical protein
MLAGIKFAFLGLAMLSTAAASSCSNGNSAQNNANNTETQQQGAAYDQLVRNQPAPTFDWSQEREIAIQLYKARQGAIATFSVVQSPFTGKVLWSCPSIGFPLPYSTQITNPNYVADESDHGSYAILPQQEPNGLYPPPSSAATWVPCVNAKGEITPVYEEKDVTVFMQPMQEGPDGGLVPVPGSIPSVSIKVGPQN